MSGQRSLFDQSPWEEDERAECLVASVVVAAGPDRSFDYLVPDELRERLEPGRRVRVPLGRGNRLVEGYCVAVECRRAGQRRLKSVHEVLDEKALLSPAMLRMTRWIAERYLCSWSTVLQAVLPAGVRAGAGMRLTTLLSLAPDVGKRLPELRLPKKQAAVVEVLVAAGGPLSAQELAHRAGCTLGPITLLRRKGLIRAVHARVQRLIAPGEPVLAGHPQCPALEPDQQRALEAIVQALRSGRHQTILVHGVTGSGKTEVYIRAIEEVVSSGRQAIVLVPEISLTPQTIERFRGRFGGVAVLHSHLSDAERHWHWQQIAAGRVAVVVGARSAVFAPAPHLGLIVLDEEHESSFKQESAPRYHARQVALARAETEGIPLVLGSATPSLESWYHAQRGRYRLVELPRRVQGLALPAVATIDLRTDVRGRAWRGAISRPLQLAMEEALGTGGQVILLLNRRGFSTHIQCPACGFVLRCPECDIALTHHRTRTTALCHYCDYETAPPARCPACTFEGIHYGGLGTQRLEAEVKARFAHAPCLRMDSDSMTGHGAHARALAAFRSGKVRILLGTQMIAKGLDFPEVTLVGVVNADTALHLPDFRAAERTFQLITQVAGRTGRGPKGGRVLVQTFTPEHPAIQAATRHDYAAFAAEELPVREALHYPPFGEMVRIVVRSASAEAAGQFAEQLGRQLRAVRGELGTGARVLGPAPAPLARLRGKYRFQIQLQGPEGSRLAAAVRCLLEQTPTPAGVEWIADVDPLNML